jgi:hypothetical protein
MITRLPLLKEKKYLDFNLLFALSISYPVIKLNTIIVGPYFNENRMSEWFNHLIVQH